MGNEENKGEGRGEGGMSDERGMAKGGGMEAERGDGRREMGGGEEEGRGEGGGGGKEVKRFVSNIFFLWFTLSNNPTILFSFRESCMKKNAFWQLSQVKCLLAQSAI